MSASPKLPPKSTFADYADILLQRYKRGVLPKDKADRLLRKVSEWETMWTYALPKNR